MKKILFAVVICAITCFCLSGCDSPAKDSEKVQIVTTIFPTYDFARQIGGDKVQVTMLLPTGTEVHSYEPTPKDIITINESDIFITLGGDAEPWTNAVINSADSDNFSVVCAMDNLRLIAEKHEHLSYSSNVHTDPHVWTTPKNAAIICENICAKLCEIDSTNAAYYRENLDEYKKELANLDEKFSALSEKCVKTIVFADQFPFRYFAEEYAIKCFAAFPGCSDDSEPSVTTVAELIDTVKAENLTTVFYTETSNQKLADNVCRETGAKKELFHSCHNVTDEQLKEGITYIELMEKNYLALQKAI